MGLVRAALMAWVLTVSRAMIRVSNPLSRKVRMLISM